MKRYFVILACSLFSAASGLPAQTVTASPTFDPTDVVINNIYDPTVVDFTNERDWRYRNTGNPSGRDLGQTFTLPSKIELKAITVRISNKNSDSLQAGAYGQSFTLRLYATTHVASLEANAYTLLSSTSFTFPPAPAARRGDFLRLELDSPIALAAGGYAFLLLWDKEGGPDKIVKLHHAGEQGANYSGGRGLEQNFGTGSADQRSAFAPEPLGGGDQDLSFAISSTPEAVSYALSDWIPRALLCRCLALRPQPKGSAWNSYRSGFHPNPFIPHPTHL